MARRLSGPSPGHPAATRSDVAAHRLAQIAAGVAGRPDPAAVPPGPPAASGDPTGDATDAAWWRDHTRVAERVAAPASPAPAAGSSPPLSPVGAASPIPVPGRHAARRSGAGVPGPVEALRRVGLPRLPVVRAGHVTIVALAVAVALALTTWWVLRDQPTSIAALSAEPASPLVELESSAGAPTSPAVEGAGGSSDGDDDAAQGGSVTVDVAGKVRRPGIVVLPVGSRVTDALAAAGGARRGVDLTSINLARPLVDGEQVLVGMAATPGGRAPSGSPSGAAAGAPGGLVNLNTADATTLEALPQVGPVTAAAIVAWRLEHGGFTSIDELLEVDGIGEATLEQIRPHATL